jgi:hypothetical protein
MSVVFQILTPRPILPHRPISEYPHLWCGGGHTRWAERGWVVNSSEDATHCSVLYMCKYFVKESKVRSPYTMMQGVF